MTTYIYIFLYVQLAGPIIGCLVSTTNICLFCISCWRLAQYYIRWLCILVSYLLVPGSILHQIINCSFSVVMNFITASWNGLMLTVQLLLTNLQKTYVRKTGRWRAGPFIAYETLDGQMNNRLAFVLAYC